MTRLRSLLFVPCANVRALEKARDLDCDTLVFDLEDAVGEPERAQAVANLAEALKGDFAAARKMVRVHPQYLNTIHKALKGAPVDGIVVPKVETPENLRGVAAVWPGLPLWAMIETAAGVANLKEIASEPHVHGLIAGPNDLRRSLRAQVMPERQDILAVLSLIVVHARAFGLVAIDGVYNQFKDQNGFAAECRQGRSLGFDGKTLIHPDQIAAANRIFLPSEDDLAWAHAVVAAFEGSTAGVVSVNGEMVERLHLETAREILDVGRD